MLSNRRNSATLHKIKKEMICAAFDGRIGAMIPPKRSPAAVISVQISEISKMLTAGSRILATP